MMRLVAWLIVLLSLPAIAYPRQFVRSYPITEDTYLDQSDDANHATGETIELRAEIGNESAPFFQLRSDDLAPGETFDSARVVIFPAYSPTHAGTAGIYRVLWNPDDATTPTWSMMNSGSMAPWGSEGCYLVGTDIASPAVATFTTWTGSRDSVVIASGASFDSFVTNYVLNASCWVVIHYDGVLLNAFCLWSSSSEPTPSVLRIYGHDALPEPTVARRRVMLEH
jgi:hypothetical protein